MEGPAQVSREMAAVGRRPSWGLSSSGWGITPHYCGLFMTLQVVAQFVKSPAQVAKEKALAEKKQASWLTGGGPVREVDGRLPRIPLSKYIMVQVRHTT